MMPHKSTFSAIGIVILVIVVTAMFIRELRWRRQIPDGPGKKMMAWRLQPYFVFYGLLFLAVGVIIYLRIAF
jgi:hypothetical protein